MAHASAAPAPDPWPIAEAPLDPSEPHITSVGTKTWIWPKPAKGGRFLGYVRIGQQVKLRSTELVRGQMCPKGFYAIEPHGYVCNDRTVTRDDAQAFLENNAHSLPRKGALPYRYAISNGAPMYNRLPSAAEQRRHEWQYGPAGKHAKLPLFSRGHEHLAEEEVIAATDEVPEFLAQGHGARGEALEVLRRTVPHGTLFSFTRAFDHGGRTFLLSTDLTVVPADRVRRFRPSRFEGLWLDGAQGLPVVWFRSEARPRFVDEGGTLVKEGEFPVRSHAAPTGEKRVQGGDDYLEVVADGKRGWARASHTTTVSHYGKRPFGVKPGDKWILVSISAGTLVAYEDMKPVFTTLVSPGLGGVPRRGGDNVQDSTTPLGVFKVTFKDRATTMAPEFGEDRKFWIADVPYTQYFDPPFALHASYWHERFGELMSGGCVNVSPKDGEALFAWTGPHVPAGWQGATGVAENGRATWVVVRR
jgi:L,D-transpeptidase catalytic domain